MTMKDLAEGLLGMPVQSCEPMPGGGNNQLFLLAVAGQRYVLKHYPPDDRDRLGAEFGALRFLFRHGVTLTPQAIACDPARRIAIYEWIEGVRPEALAAADLEQMFSLVAALDRLRLAPDAQDLPAASHASLDFAAPQRQFAQRWQRLQPVLSQHEALRDFALNTLQPFQQGLLAPYAALLAQHGCALAAPLPASALCLSPSDFGRHNLLRRRDGRLCFLDFEYFGWDDAVKFSCDLVLHPGSALSPAMRRMALTRALQQFAPRDPLFAARLPAMLGLCGSLWCLIILNVFIPEIWQRRVLAGEQRSLAEAGAQQLELARGFFVQLQEVIDDCPSF
ncbi:aminoglycoside phosphotransferase family protein [Paludibacterium sp. B53371]|uniref:aminoglycoside phosphotransferase family protein n=1 Tax=Paludibacterium sp. B53371 TaxID=2806263 RepID=UPI001C048C6D|nr:aminoglycoside phosphotransferase family protein [Paludibacterium sp. B53371]